MKKLLLTLLALLLLTAPFALAEETEEPTTYTSGDWQYILLPDGTAEIVDYTGDAAKLTIPADLDGYAVTSIGDRAFAWCDSLTSITLPDSVISIGVNPFERCYALTSIIVSPEHPTLAVINGVLFYKPEKRLICYPRAFTDESYAVPQGIRSIGDSAFSWCDPLTSITLPDSLTSIGDSAFSFCFSLTSITLPDSVTSIGDSAFVFCKSMTSITLPDTLTSIGDYAFSSCESMTSITLPDTLTSIGANPFEACSSLTSIIVSPEHPTLAVINGVLFYKPEKRLICYPCAFTAESYAVPQGIRSIGDSAFYSCDSLTSLTLPDSVTTIGDWAFRGCDSLTSITLPDGLTSIGDLAFADCSPLTSVTLPDTLTSIGVSAFYYCPSLTLTIPRNTWLTDWCKENNIPYTYPDALDWLLE